jgi:hypothetical protein
VLFAIRFKLTLKRQCHEIFDPRFFSLNSTPGSPDSWAKTVLHIDSNSRSYSTTKIDSALCRRARSRFFLLDNAKFILFYCHGVGKITYDRFFLKTVTLTASVKAERILFRLPAMRKDSAPCGIARSRFSF